MKTSQISLGTPTPLIDKTVLLDERTNARWQTQLIDDHGNGVVVSWGFGCPESRLGRPGPPQAHPFFSLTVFTGGAVSFVMQRRPSVSKTVLEQGRFQAPEFQVEALRDMRSSVVIVRVDAALPGTRDRVVGHVEFGGLPPRLATTDNALPNDFAPFLGPGEGRAILRVGAHHFHLAGRATAWRHVTRVDGDRGSSVLVATLPDEDRLMAWTHDESGAPHAIFLSLSTTGFSNVHDALTFAPSGDGFPNFVTDDGHKFLGGTLRAVAGMPPLTTAHVGKLRAPMMLPGSALLSTFSGANTQRQLRRARACLIDDDDGTSFAARFHLGVRRERWARVLPFGR